MGQQPPPEVQDFHLRDAQGVLRHLLQLDAEELAAFFTQGFVDVRAGGDAPDNPPEGRRRIYELLGGLFSKDNAGTVKALSAATRIISMPSQGGFIDGTSPDDGKQTARAYDGLGLIFLEGFQNIAGTGGPGDPGIEADGNGGLTKFIVLRAFDDATGASALRFTLAIPFPSDFVAWGDDGIRWWTRLVTVSGPSGEIEPTIEVFDPLTGASFTTAVDDSRVVDDGDDPEAAYVALQITKAQLDAELERWNAAKGIGLLAFECSLPPGPGGAFPGETYDFNIGAIEIDWLRG